MSDGIKIMIQDHTVFIWTKVILMLLQEPYVASLARGGIKSGWGWKSGTLDPGNNLEIANHHTETFIARWSKFQNAIGSVILQGKAPD